MHAPSDPNLKSPTHVCYPTRYERESNATSPMEMARRLGGGYFGRCAFGLMRCGIAFAFDMYRTNCIQHFHSVSLANLILGAHPHCKVIHPMPLLTKRPRGDFISCEHVTRPNQIPYTNTLSGLHPDGGEQLVPADRRAAPDGRQAPRCCLRRFCPGGVAAAMAAAVKVAPGLAARSRFCRWKCPCADKF